MTDDHLMVVMSNVVPGREDEFNDWYTNEHIIDVVEKLPGFVSAQRYELSPVQIEQKIFRYMAIYHIPADQLEEAQHSVLYQRAERQRALAEGRRPMLTVSETFSEPHFNWFFSPMTGEVRAAVPPKPLR